MAKNNKIAWMESQYIYPHHFQQQERYLESRLEQRTAAIKPYIWGISELTFDHALLMDGKLAIEKTTGIMPDGSPFELPHQAPLPDPILVPSRIKNELILLVLPLYQPGSRYIETTDNNHSIARYRMQEIDVFDYCSDHGNVEKIESATLQFKLALENEDLGGFSCLPIARIQEVTQEGAIILDKHYIPPSLSIRASNQLHDYASNVIGLLKQRGDVLAYRFNASGQEGGASAIADFLLLQLINRYQPRMQHLTHLPNVHPERLFIELLGIMGELATFTTTEKRPASTMPYDHNNLHRCFEPIMEHLGKHLSAVMEQTAIALPVEARQYGIYVSRIADRTLLAQARFILAINADMATEKLRSYLSNHIKVGSVETIRELVNNQLPGIAVTSLPVAPREIPYHAGYLYFELDTQSEQWQSLHNSGGFSFHISRETNDLSIEFWAIRH
ncbi:MAG: type VI secretion system protein ImpJ [Pseudohongiellaceae bacterium]|jgi:type VI secretion system protein ImpJ